MGLISPGGENLLDFLELRQVLSTYHGDLRDPLWWPQGRPVPMRIPRGPLGKGTDPLIHAKGSVSLLLELGRKAHVHAPTRDEY